MNRVALNVDEVFFAALELEDQRARSSYLDEICGSDAGFRRRIEGLLAVSSLVSKFLESPAVPQTKTFDSPFAERPGTVIGAYKLMEQIGEGGMGAVYVAEQAQPIRRRVALKVIKFGMGTEQVVARFEAERQALAMMDHPNIAKVLDAGATETGRSYFVMELVRGIPITEYCDREQLTIPERLDLFVLVCRAVQHAHQKGIIHRDLKPSNILVTVIDGAAVPKIIDFGVAKATGASLTGKTIYTAFNQFVGTPLYMSPEQADLSGMDIDTRSDIYSLGVLLYELLTGSTPFDQDTFRQAAFDEIRRIIREVEPPKPSARLSSLVATRSTVSANRKADARQLGRTVLGELDWIVMKSLEKDRRRRYQTANDFASDVMRHLTNQPVEACPPSTWYRFSKSARRNRVMLTTTALIGLALIGGSAVSAWQASRARKAASEATARADETKQVVNYLMKEILGASAPEKWRAGRPMTVTELLDDADATIAERFRGQPLVEARCRMALGELYLLSNTVRAESHAIRAVALLTQAFGPDHPETLQARGLQVYVIGFWINRPEKCEEHVRLSRSLLEARRRVLGPVHPDTILTMTGMVPYLTVLGHLDDAEDLGRRAYADAERALGSNHAVTLAAKRNLAYLARDRGQFTRAESLMRSVTDAQLQIHGLLHPESIRNLADLSDILQSGGKIAEAVPLARSHYDAAREFYGPSGTWTRWATGGLVSLYRAQGDMVAIRDLCLLRISDILATQRPTEHSLAKQRSVDLASAALQLVTLPDTIPFDTDVALRAALEAVELDGDWDDSWTVLGVVYYRLGQLDEAMSAIQTSMKRPRWKGGDDFDWLVLALIHARRGDLDGARAWYDKARNRKDPVDFNRDDLQRLRDEAIILLGIESTQGEVKAKRGSKSTKAAK